MESGGRLAASAVQRVRAGDQARAVELDGRPFVPNRKRTTSAASPTCSTPLELGAYEIHGARSARAVPVGIATHARFTKGRRRTEKAITDGGEADSRAAIGAAIG